MAWNISKAKRQALVKLQLRDKNGKFIEMGGGVKWYSSRLRKVVSGTVVGTKGENALVRLHKENPTHEPALVAVPARSIEPIDAKASLPGKGEKSNLDTPEFEKPEAVGKVKGDDAEVDPSTESDHEKSVSEVSPEEMRAMPKGTVLRSFKGQMAGFIKQDGDNWQHILSNGDPSGNVSTSASIKNTDTFQNHVFSPEGTPISAPQDGGNGNSGDSGNGGSGDGGDGPDKPTGDDDSAENYSISETSDGNTYISKKDGSELYSPARELQVGDEVFAPAGADETKPFSIGRNWATKGAERLNNDGPKLGKVIAVEGDRYAVVQMAGGHTIPDRRNPDETSDTVTIGLSNRVIKATEGLKAALGDKLGDTNYGDRPSDEDQEVTPNDPLAQSDHVGREATPEQIAEEEAQGAAPEQDPEAVDPKTAKPVLTHRITGAAKDELEFGIENMESDGVDPGVRMSGSKAEVYDVDAAIITVDGPLGVLDDNLNDDVYQGSHKAIAKAKQRGLQRLRDVLSKAKGENSQKPEQAPEAPAADATPEADAPAAPKAPEAPQNAPEADPAPETPKSADAPAEDAPKAPEAAPAPEAQAPEADAPAEAPKEAPQTAATASKAIVEGVGRVEQDMEDIDSGNLQGEELAAALEEAKYSFNDANGEQWTVAADRVADGEWSYNLTDQEGSDKGNWLAANYDGSAEIAKDIEKTVNGGAPSRAEPAPEAKPEADAPAAPESYNENGLTDEEQATVTALTRMIGRAENAGQFERADALSAQMADLVAKGESRKNGTDSEAPAPAEKPAEAPSSAPEPEAAPEPAPKAEAAPEAVAIDADQVARSLTSLQKSMIVAMRDHGWGSGNRDIRTGSVRNSLQEKGLIRFGRSADNEPVFVITDEGRAVADKLEPSPEAETTKSEFLNGYDINSDSGLGRVKKDFDGHDFVLENTTPELISALPVGSTVTTLDPDKLDAFQPVVKLADNQWGREKALGDRGFDLFEDNQMLEHGVEQGVKLPSNPGIEFSPEEVERAKQSVASQAAADEAWRQNLNERAARNSAPAPAATPEAAPQAPLVEGQQDEIKIPGVRKQAKRDDKSAKHLKELDKLEEGDRVSHTNARGEKSTYQKHADGTWDEIDPNDEFPEDSPIREAIPASEIADMHKRGDLKVTKAGEEETPDAPAATPAQAPEQASEAAPAPDAAPETDAPAATEEAPSKVVYSRDLAPDVRRAVSSYADEHGDDAGFRVENGRMLEVTDLDKAQQSFRNIVNELNAPGTSRASNISRNRVQREARAMLVRLNTEIENRDRDNTKAQPVNGDPDFTPIDGKVTVQPDGSQKFTSTKTKRDEAKKAQDEAGQEPSDVQDAELDDNPPEQEKVDPISDEQAGRLLETLTAENPLPEGIERHVPEAVEGEDYAPTQQQQDVIDAVLGGLNTLVQAKAGAGKTSTLRAIARRLKLTRPDAKVGYIAFNKSVQLEANGSMPNNTEARTGHSIAMAWAQEWMQKRLTPKTVQNPHGFLSRPSDWADHLGIHSTLDNNGKAFSTNSQAMAVKRTLDAYAFSKDDTIGAQHLPESVREMPEHIQDVILQHADAAWFDMKDRNGRLRMSLDQIRKQWALSRPDFSKPGSGLSRPVSVLFLDEAQDTPPVLAKVIADQKNVQKVIVGDADQAIYGFTGATDYLSEAEGDVELPLNKSWRFGPAVADMGNRFLQIAESPQRVVGGGDSKIVENMQDADAVLVRSNGGMLGEIGSELERGRIVGVSEKTKDDLKSLVATARYLRDGGRAPRTLHEDLADFHTWGEFLQEVDKGDDQNLAKIARMIDTFGLDKMDELIDSVVATGGSVFNAITFEDHPTAGLIARGDTYPARTFMRDAGFRWVNDPSGAIIPAGRNNAGQREKVWAAQGTPAERQAKLDRAKELGAATEPDVVISTAHKAKGLEWDRVRIGDDFWAPKVDPDTGEVEMVKPEELRLNYVAVTRAAKELDLGSLAWVLDHSDENGGAVPSTTEKDLTPSLQSGDEDRTKSPVKSAPEEIAPEEAPVVDSTPEPSPAVDATPEAVPAPEAESTPEVPSYNENGLTEVEQATLDYANGRLDRARAGSDTARIDDLEREVNNIMEHGERRNAGETLPEYDPEQIRDDAEEVPDVEDEPVSTEHVPMGRRTRRDYSGVILRDANGNDLSHGDIVGHRTHGPVQITGLTPASGRIQFINTKTGHTGSVDASLVTRMDAPSSDAPDAPEAATPDAPEANIPDAPGTLFIDPSTGKKAFIDKHGNKVVKGDRVVDSRNGNAGEVVGVYRAADGGAWPAIKFDGETSPRRVKGHLVHREGSEAPEATPEAPSAPEAAPEAPSTPEVPETVVDAPEAAPEAPAGRSLTGSRTDIHNALNAAPIGSTVVNTMNGKTYTKLGDNVWGTEGVGSHTSLDLARSASIAQVQNPFEITVAEAPAVEAPNAPSAETPFEQYLPGESPMDSVRRRLGALKTAGIGSEITSVGGEHHFTKLGEGNWHSDSDPSSVLNESDVLGIILGGEGRGLSYTHTRAAGSPEAPTTPEAPEAPATGITSADRTTRRAAYSEAPIGSTVTSSHGDWVKTGDDEWNSDRYGEWSDGDMANLSRPGGTGNYGDGWTMTHPVEDPQVANTGGELIPSDHTGALNALGLAPVGSKLVASTGVEFEKTGLNRWVGTTSGAARNNAEMAALATFDDTEFHMSLPDPSAPNFDALNSDSEDDRNGAIRNAPIGSVLSSTAYTFTKTGSDEWTNQYGSVYNAREMESVTQPSSPFGGNWKLSDADGNPIETPIVKPEAPAPKAAQVFSSDIEVGSFMPNSPGSKSGLKKVGDNQWEMMNEGASTGRIVDDNAAGVIFDLTKPKIEGPVPDYGLSDFDGTGRSFHDFMMDNNNQHQGVWGMEYRSTANLTPQQQGAIRDAYTKFVAEVNKKMPAGYSARLSSGPSFGNGGKFDTTINFYKDDQLGRGRVGYASRSFGIEDIFGIKRTKVYHAFFELDKDVQGVGINNAFLGESLKLYDQLGLDAVRVTANIDVGGYTWARSGFNFLSLNTLNNTIDDMRARIAAHGRTMPQKTRRATAHFTPKMWEDALKTLDELKLKATQANFDAGMAPSAVELSQIGWNSTIGRGRDSMWVGKAVMLGLNWSGVRGIDAERNLRK